MSYLMPTSTWASFIFQNNVQAFGNMKFPSNSHLRHLVQQIQMAVQAGHLNAQVIDVRSFSSTFTLSFYSSARFFFLYFYISLFLFSSRMFLQGYSVSIWYSAVKQIILFGNQTVGND